MPRVQVQGKGSLRERDIIELVSQVLDSNGAPELLKKIDSKLSTSNFSVAVFHEILKHLDAQLIPDLRESRWNLCNASSLCSRRGSNALRILDSALSSPCTLHSPSRDAIASVVVDRLDDICRWTKHHMHQVEYMVQSMDIDMDEVDGSYNTHIIDAWTLCRLVEQHDTIFQGLLSLPMFFDLLFSFWMPTTPGKVVMAREISPACPVLTLVYKVAGHEGGRETLINMTLTRGTSFRRRFVLGFIQRLKQIAGYKPGMAMDRINGLLLITEKLLRDLTTPRTLRRTFMKLAYLTQCMRTLSSISAKILDDNPGKSHPSELSQTLVEQTYSSWTASILTHAVDRYRAAISGGALPHLARTLLLLSSGNAAATSIGVSCIDLLGSYMFYPSVIRHLDDTGGINESWGNELLQNPSISPSWGRFMEGLRVIRAAYHSRRGDHIASDMCYNPLCDWKIRSKPKVSGPRTEQQLPKQCSTCQSVVYCSSACQAQDWKAQHRTECKNEAKYRSADQLNILTKYTHEARWFHAYLVAILYNNTHKKLIGPQSPFPTIQIQILLPMFYLVTLDFQRSAMTKPLVHPPNTDDFFTGENEGEEWWLEGRGIELGQTWLRPRMFELVGMYRCGEIPNKDLRLAQGVFRLGPDHLVYLTVRLERFGGEKFVPTYCVAKLAEVLRDEIPK